jgi:hypothetical protein
MLLLCLRPTLFVRSATSLPTPMNSARRSRESLTVQVPVQVGCYIRHGCMTLQLLLGMTRQAEGLLQQEYSQLLLDWYMAANKCSCSCARAISGLQTAIDAAA